MLNSMKNANSSRREFLRAAGRLPLLCLLVATGGALLERRRNANAACTRDLICRECPSLSACPLPQAGAFKTSNPR
jgi:hypothetical protein